MLVKYTGRYHSGPAVNYRGLSFTEGEYREVSEEWYEANKGDKVSVKPKRKTAKSADDGDSVTAH